MIFFHGDSFKIFFGSSLRQEVDEPNFFSTEVRAAMLNFFSSWFKKNCQIFSKFSVRKWMNQILACVFFHGGLCSYVELFRTWLKKIFIIFLSFLAESG